MSTERPPDDNVSLSDSDASNRPTADVDRDPFEELASEFAERQRNGEFPSVEEYAKAHPDLAEEIRDLFPTIAAMEQLKERKAPPPKPTLGGLPLEQLGDFRILGEIGRGGMGVVYEAEQVSLGRRVAVKVLPKQALLDERHLRRFEREAQTAAKLHHTNIVPVFGVGQQDGYHYIVMQFIPGVGLDEILIALRALVLDDDSRQFRTDSGSRASHASHNARALLEGNFSRALSGGFSTSFHKQDTSGTQDLTLAAATVAMEPGEMSQSTAEPAIDGKSLDSDASEQLSLMDHEFYRSIARIGSQVADALAYAHEQGTLHRDIKPGNLLLDGTGTVWVADFGLAKLTEQENVSRTGDIVGTLSYMPPESFSGETDGRGDIYALGLTLFEMLALRPAFFGRDRAKLVKQITEGELPRLGKLNPSIPRDLETIVLKAVAHRPEDRYATARELTDDLQRYLDDVPILARRMSVPEQFVRWCRKNKLVASLAASVLSLLIITAGVITYSAEQRANEQTRLAQLESQRAQLADDAAEKQRRAADEQRRLRGEAKQTANEALSALLTIIDRLFPNRLPLSANESLQVAESSTELTTTGDLETEENAATVAPPPITEETAASLAVFRETFDRLAKRAGNDELGIVFAELTLRVGKLHKMLGNNEDALASFEDAIRLFTNASATNPQTALIGLAMSHNEKGDVLANNWDRSALSSYRQALELFDQNEDLLANSTRAQYEKARTLFLMSVERSGFPTAGGGRSGVGRRPGPGAQRRGPGAQRRGEAGPGGRGGQRGRGGFFDSSAKMARLQEAINILKKLKESDPEYTYLLARCHSGLSVITSFGERELQQESINEAMSLLNGLVQENPDIADYKFEYGFVQLRSLDILRRDGKTESDVIANVVKLVEEIATRNPGVWNYTMLHLMALGRQTVILDRYADQLARQDDPRVPKLRIEAMQAANRAAAIKDQASSRFPSQIDSLSMRFEGLAGSSFLHANVLAKAGHHEEAVQLYRQILENVDEQRRGGPRSVHEIHLELAKSLNAIGEQKEAQTLLTATRDELKESLDDEISKFESSRGGPPNRRFYEPLRLMTKFQSELIGPEGTRDWLRSIREARVDALKAADGREATPIELAELDLQMARCFRDMNDQDRAERLLDKVHAEVRAIRTEWNVEELRDASAEIRAEHVRQRMAATGLLWSILMEKQDRAAIQKLFTELPEERRRIDEIAPEWRRGRGGPRGGRSEGRNGGRGDGSTSRSSRPD